jgi:arabinogalactan endo-1,4-beta-galactosidase
MKKEFIFMNKHVLYLVGLLGVVALTGCGGSQDISFTYKDVTFTPNIGVRTNQESINYDSIIINPVIGIRSDFAMGVDASMVLKVEEMGGIYYNRLGQEQDVFQIMADEGVNFFRVRIWNQPFDKFGEGFGGGDVNTARAIEMSKRAQAAGMNIMVNLHYSDFWADPDTQDIPTRWVTYSKTEMIQAVETFTTQVLSQFKTAGVDVQAIQIGNEINNGILWPMGKIDFSNPKDGFDFIADILKAGIKGAKAVNNNIYSIIHLANGGSKDEFNDYFTQINRRSVAYDIIGVSYYPFYHGSLNDLQQNLDNIANVFNKPVMVVEMSYGFTNASTAYASNIYSSQMEEAGKYLTSVQGQATAIRDVINVLAQVPKNKGMGIFYWEPGWLPVQGAGWATIASGRVSNVDGQATWSNQALFTYSGRVLPSMRVFRSVKQGTPVEEIPLRVRSSNISVTLNLAANETLPSTYGVETNFDAIRQVPVTWNSADLPQLQQIGTHTVRGVVQGGYSVNAQVTVIENFIVDPGFEAQGSTDAVLEPWIIEYANPTTGLPVVKLNRKPQDVRSGNTSLNWYHGSETFFFKVKQSLTLQPGTYSLTAYIMAISRHEIPHATLEIYIRLADQTLMRFDYSNLVAGWGTPANFYIQGSIPNIVIGASQTVEVGIIGEASAGAWGHLDDWILVRQN